METKKRVLFIGEASFLATGFSTYLNEVIQRLHKTGEFEIAEMGSYAYADDPRCQQVPWKFYPVAPAKSDQKAMAEYAPNVAKHFGEGIFDEVCLDCKPDIVCLLRDWWMDEFVLRSAFRNNFKVCLDPDTSVLTPDGTKNIGDIIPGDVVLTHRGKPERVTATTTFKTDKPIVSIRPSMWFESIRATIDHKFLAVKYDGRTWDEQRNRYAKNVDQYDIDDSTWIEADQLTSQDILIMPREHIKNSDPFIKICDFTERQLDYKVIHKMDYIRSQNKCHNGHWIKNHQVIDDDFALLCGYFLAEGTSSQHLISFCFHKNETTYIDDVLRIVKNKFEIEGKVRQCPDSLAVNVTFCSVLLSDLFSCFYTNDKRKRIPQWLLEQPNDIISQVLCGWMKGDGCLTNTCHDQSMVEGFTSSKYLAIQLFRICCRLRLVINLIRRKNGISRFKDHISNNIGGYRLQFQGLHGRRIAEQVWPERKTAMNFSKISKHRTWFDKYGNLLTQIRSIDKNIDHDGMVCDITVENDHSFLTPFITHNCWMPTIDGEPQRELWLDSYLQCDRILTYSNYGMDLLKKTARKNTKLVTIASPGSDLDMFKPPDDKKKHKASLGIDPNSFIIGTVMRNQKRKLYYDLIEAFSDWVYSSKTKGHVELARKTFLYLHTSYPDVGYDIGKAIRDFKIGNKVIMTYLCSECHTAYPSFFAGELMVCRKCGKLAAHPPNAEHSCPRSVLAGIMQTFDLYVQYSICLHPDTPIMTSNGYENIGNISVGDKVIGKDGKLHRVYKTAKNKPDKCFDLKIKSRPWTVTATDNHPWLVLDRTGLKKGIESIINRERYHKNRGTGCPALKFAYKRTDELKSGDLLASRIPTEEILPNYDLTFMDEDMAYYIGLFAADGHANETCGQCTITSHSHEAGKVMEVVQRVAEKIGKNAKQYPVKDRDAVSTNICDTKFRNIIRHLCYDTDDRTKKLPDGCHLWPKNLQESLVRGLIYGDGYEFPKKPWVNVYCTTSVHIAKIVGSIFERLGWYYCSYIQYRENRLPMYRFEVRTDGQRRSHETLYRDGFVLCKVASLNPSDFENDVITIDIEDDHNYNTICGMSHNCEGFGMPCLDAIACGVPVAAVDYSAMQDHLRCPTSIPIKVQRFFWEAIIETEQKRALPDNRDFVSKLDRFLKFSDEKRQEISRRTREYAVELVETYGTNKKMPRYGWERTTEIWRNVLRETSIKDRKTTWLCNIPKIRKPNLVPPGTNMDNSEFVNWVIGKIWGRPEMLHTHFAGEWLKCLNSGARTMGDKRVPFDRNQLVNHFMEMVKQSNEVEQKRMNMLDSVAQDDINTVVM